MGEFDNNNNHSRGWCGWFVIFLIASFVISAFVIAKTKKDHLEPQGPPAPGRPGAIVGKYADALKIAMQFFDVQKSGKLEHNNIPWRKDSGLEDGKPVPNLDLSKGMYDAGGSVKSVIPMGFTATILSWTILEYGERMDKVGQLTPALESLRWITDYLINAHPQPDLLYVQVGDAEKEKACWNKPENVIGEKPVYQVNGTWGGSDVAGETSAAMASASVVFKNRDDAYSNVLLDHAVQLFHFADKNLAAYTDGLPQLKKYYNSKIYGDELLWASSWLYLATSNVTYLEYSTNGYAYGYGKWGSPSWFSWDDKAAAVQVLMSRVNMFGGKDSKFNNLHSYRRTAEIVMCNLLPNSERASPNRTNAGLIWVSELNPVQHAMASAFLAMVYSDYMLSSRAVDFYCDADPHGPSDLQAFARSQVDYVLGQNPMNMSYVVGYGSNYPQFVRHRGASIPENATVGCVDGFKWLNSTAGNPNIAFGALVGGPLLNDTYIDSRSNEKQAEPTTYNSALLVGVLSGLLTSSSVNASYSVE